MSIVPEPVEGVVVLEPDARLDVSSAPALRQALERSFERAGQRVLIDLGRVDYISSIGLSALLVGAKLAQAQGGRVVVTGLAGIVQRAFQLSGLDSLIRAFASRETALQYLATAADRPAQGSHELHTGLSLPEELLLLTLRDDGRSIDLPEGALDFALAGAVIMDLCQRERVDSDLERLSVVDPRPVGEPLLDPALAAIARTSARHPAEHWIGVLATEGAEIHRSVVDRLVERGVLVRKASVLHWVLGGRRYPIVQDRGQREIKERVLGVLRHGEAPGPREVAIVALADACAVFDALIEMDDMLDLRPRIAEVARMDLLAQAMQTALREARGRDPGRSTTQGMYGRTADIPS